MKPAGDWFGRGGPGTHHAAVTIGWVLKENRELLNFCAAQAPSRLIEASFRAAQAPSRLIEASFRAVKAPSRPIEASFRAVKAPFRPIEASSRAVEAPAGSLQAYLRTEKAAAVRAMAGGYCRKSGNRMRIERGYARIGRGGIGNTDWHGCARIEEEWDTDERR